MSNYYGKKDVIKVIFNHYAGRGNGARNENRIRQALTKANISFDLQKTQGAGHAIQLARQARFDGYNIVVAAGGDGTVSEVVNGLAEATPANECVRTLGILPLGSGNDFASAVGCPLNIHHAIAAITKKSTRRVDLGFLELRNGLEKQQRYFNNNLATGFEAKATQSSQQIKYLRGLPMYTLGIFKALRHYTPSHFNLQWLSITGEVKSVSQPMLMITIGNSHLHGGGFSINKNAKLDDGMLDLSFAPAVSKQKILNLLVKVFFGTHMYDPVVNQHQCLKARISSNQNILFQVDGELLLADDFDIELQPKRLEVIVK